MSSFSADISTISAPISSWRRQPSHDSPDQSSEDTSPAWRQRSGPTGANLYAQRLHPLNRSNRFPRRSNYIGFNDDAVSSVSSSSIRSDPPLPKTRYKGLVIGDYGSMIPGRDITAGLRRLLDTIRIIPSLASFSDRVHLAGFETWASYNWLDLPTPTMLIPGGPPIWTERALPIKLRPDSGMSYVDQNGFRSPNCPLEPMIQAVTLLQPAFSFATLDVVCDRNSLRKPLRWISGDTTKPFRIGAEILGEEGGCLTLTRWEARDKETGINESGIAGWGHSFVEAMTSPEIGCEKACDYHSIARYDLGELSILMRFAADAQMPKSRSKQSPSETSAAHGKNDNINDLLGRMTLSAESQSSPRPTLFPKSTLSYIKSPSTNAHPHSILLELKSRSTRNTVDIQDTYPQLFLSQTPNLFIGKHNRGDFITVEKVRLEGDDFRSEGERIAPDLGKLVWILKEMRSIALRVKLKGKGNGVAFMCRETDLQAWEVEDKAQRKLLAPHLLKLFNGKIQSANPPLPAPASARNARPKRA